MTDTFGRLQRHISPTNNFYVPSLLSLMCHLQILSLMSPLQLIWSHYSIFLVFPLQLKNDVPTQVSLLWLFSVCLSDAP
ncbi:hypothetical protein XENTR_v10004976 [Xenopus tropicalis]|nr:hypothetical protein XENTR_v10004976 [Xenopus tropicalis]